MRVIAIPAALGLGLSITAAEQVHADVEFNDLIQCAGAVNAAGAISMGIEMQNRALSEQNETMAAAPIEFNALHYFAALVARMGDATHCQIPFEQVMAETVEEVDRRYHPISAAYEGFVLRGEDDTEFNRLWQSLRAELACVAVLTEEDIERGQQVMELGTGFPCGWEP